MIRRRVFYSFDYALDSWRAATVRNIGVVEGNRPATDNQWEEVMNGGDAAIRDWIDRQMKYRSCTIVLVGARTADRRWVQYEIKKSWELGMGLAGIRIDHLLNQEGLVSWRGRNPFERFTVHDRDGNRRRLSEVVKCYDPDGVDSTERYGWIRKRLDAMVEEAIRIRSKYP